MPLRSFRPAPGVGFQTYQNVSFYEQALQRHAQKFQWMRGYLCPCTDAESSQPNPLCAVCKGRGRIYKPPHRVLVRQELAHHTSAGVVTTQMRPYYGTPVITHKDQVLPLAPVQPPDRLSILLAEPYPERWRNLFVDYEYDLTQSVTGENSTVITTNLLQVNVGNVTVEGRRYSSCLQSVTRVWNVTRSESYTVTGFDLDYVFLSGMGTWVSGDVLEVDYTYVAAVNFLISGVSPKLRYEKPYIHEQAEAVLVTPYWAKVGVGDLLTALAQEMLGQAVVHPGITGAGHDDVVPAYWYLTRLVSVVDVYGHEYSVGTDVILVGLNTIRWLTTKPTTPYSLEFYYSPTWVALTSFQSIRTAENKAFVNRVSVMQYDPSVGGRP